MSLVRTVSSCAGERRSRLLLPLAAAGAALALAAPASGAVLGFTETAEHRELSPSAHQRLIDMERAAGGELHRLTLLWSDVEPYLVNGSPVQNWSYYDRVIGDALARGARPVIVIMAAPDWAQKPLECQGNICPPAPGQLGAWSRFAYDVAKRYPGAGAIEIWNEPNLRGQWTTSAGPDPERYAQLFSHAAGAVHYADPSIPVLIGGITFVSQDEPKKRLTIETFMERFYWAGGGGQLRSGDGFSLHAYPWINELETLDGLFARTVRETRDVLARFDPQRKIWITETGVTTTGPWAVGERAQAKGILALVRKANNMEDVRAVMIHSTVEAPYNSHHTHEQGYGVVKRASLAPKLAYCALAERAGADRSFTGCPAGVLADLDGDAADSGGSGGDSSAGEDGGILDNLVPLRLKQRGRRVCRKRLRRRAAWADASRAERRVLMRRCVRRYVRRHA